MAHQQVLLNLLKLLLCRVISVSRPGKGSIIYALIPISLFAAPMGLMTEIFNCAGMKNIIKKGITLGNHRLGLDL